MLLLLETFCNGAEEDVGLYVYIGGFGLRHGQLGSDARFWWEAWAEESK